MSIRRIGLLAIALAALIAMSVGLAGAQAVPAQGKWTGEINAADATQLVVSGVRFAATGVQVDAGLSLTPGTVVQVKFTAANGSLNAVKVERLEAGAGDLPGTGKITGTIDSAAVDTVSIGGVPFNVLSARIDDDASLNAGALVELRFTFNGTVLTVSRIEAEDDENDAKAVGVIEAMDATTITVGGVAFDITGAQIDDDGVLAVGVLVEIEFTVAADGRVIALEIDFEDDDIFDDNGSDDDNDRESRGAIEAMSGSTITVNGQVFDISQAEIDDEGTLAVGVVVDIDYVTTTDGRNVALEVEIEGGSDDQSDDDNFRADFVLSGRIEAINESSLTVNGITVDINGVDDDDDLEVGDVVTIYFRRDAGGALTVIEVDEIDDIDDPFDDDRDDDDDDDRDGSDDDNGSDDRGDDDDVTVINGCVRPDGWQTYRVGRGDTLSRIAGAANTTVDALVTANCLTSANFITVGQQLFVPIRVNRLDDDNDDRRGDDDDDDDDDRDDNDDDDRDDDDNGDNDDDDDRNDDDDNEDDGDDDDDDDDGDDD